MTFLSQEKSLAPRGETPFSIVLFVGKMTVWFARGEISRSGASDFALGGKVTKTPLGTAAPSPRCRLTAGWQKSARRIVVDTALRPLAAAALIVVEHSVRPYNRASVVLF